MSEGEAGKSKVDFCSFFDTQWEGEDGKVKIRIREIKKTNKHATKQYLQESGEKKKRRVLQSSRPISSPSPK